MTIHEALNPKKDIDRLYVTRKEVGRLHRCNNSKTQDVQKNKKRKNDSLVGWVL